MSKDYYKTLNVEKTADQGQVKKAFYKLAQKYHPDKPGGDEAKFKEINEAYQTLSDEKKRAQYDQFGSGGNPFGGQGGGGGFGGGGFNFDFGGQGIDLDDILRQFAGGGFGGQRAPRGRDVQMTLELPLKDAVMGIEKEIEIPNLETDKPGDTKKVKVSIPSGIENGQRVRLPGYGQTIENGEAGDLYLVVMIAPHKSLKREGQHLIASLRLTLSEAILGVSREIETLEGTTKIKIPAGTQADDILRLKGKGVPGSGGMFGSRTGDILVRVNIEIPEKLSKKAREAVEILKAEGL